MLYILLPVYNRKQTTEKFIKCLIKQNFQEFRLILIDDGSIDGTEEMALSYLPESIILKGDGNLWWAGGLQKGYEWLLENASDDDICLIMNDDVVFDEKFLSKGIEIISRKSKTLLAPQCYSQYDHQTLDSGVKADFITLKFRRAQTKDEINCLTTRGLFLKVRDFKAIGGFFPRILPHYLSDYEFTLRAFRKGFRLYLSEEIKLFVDTKTTGFHELRFDGILDYYTKFFSNRNPLNPVHWLGFIILAVPYPYKIYHFVLRIFWMILFLIIPYPLAKRVFRLFIKR